MRYIKKTHFRSFNDLIYTLNHIPCKENKKTIIVSDSVYHMLLISEKIKKGGY